jgi:hypothetical protein
MTTFDQLLFMPLDLPPPSLNEVSFLDTVPYKEMHHDEYRNCYHINLITSKGEKTKWLTQLPQIADWIKKTIRPIFEGRTMIIVTPPGESNTIHIDCSPDKFNTVQHKFRYVLRGPVNGLKFQFKDKQVCLPQISQPYIIEGKWPHHMDNYTQQRKYTIAIGYPWEPSLRNNTYLGLLEKSHETYHKKAIYYESYDQLPPNWERMYDPKYLGGETPSWHKLV